MDLPDEMNEKLREVCCTGKTDAMMKLLANGADVNSQNKVNGWTCLHWAAKRGHISLIRKLLDSGANVDVKNFKGELAYDLSYSNDIRNLLRRDNESGVNCNTDNNSSFQPIATSKSQFLPNYLKHPVFPYTYKEPAMSKTNTFSAIYTNSSSMHELVLKVRNGSSQEKDFIEIELDRSNLTFQNLLTVCCSELQMESSMVKKVRKLPNTIVRKDKDVTRLKDFQEIELLLKHPVI